MHPLTRIAIDIFVIRPLIVLKPFAMVFACVLAINFYFKMVCLQERVDYLERKGQISVYTISDEFMTSRKLLRLDPISSTNDIPLWYHEGGKRIPEPLLIAISETVLEAMPNVQNTQNMVNLILETTMVETDMGESNFKLTAKRYNNHGIAQFRLDTARFLIDWLEKNDKEAHESLMKFYMKEKSLSFNVTHNIPFSLALMVQYYKHREPELEKKINSISQRAKLWKSVYNTPAGAGTVSRYVKKVSTFYRSSRAKESATSISDSIKVFTFTS